MRQLILANISLINLKAIYNYIDVCVYRSVCVFYIYPWHLKLRLEIFESKKIMRILIS